jgi:excisionase family DNA binding protein
MAQETPHRTVAAVEDVSAQALYSIADVSTRLGLHRNTVKRLIATGQLPHVKLGRRVLIDPRDVERLIEANRRVGTAA